MYDKIVTLLAAIGYTNVTDNDTILLNFMISEVESHIKNEINWQEIPEGLEAVAINRVIGKFLLAKKTFSPADLSMLDLDAVVKQIQAGDTNYVFAVGEGSETDESRLTSFINYLLSYGESDFSAFRRIRWG